MGSAVSKGSDWECASYGFRRVLDIPISQLIA
jgi:hypothetical protein